jgi:transcriptional regulator with XRE-family HTH domain
MEPPPLAARLVARRQELNLSRREVAARTSLSRSHVLYIERGDSRPGDIALQRLATGLNLDLDELKALRLTPKEHLRHSVMQIEDHTLREHILRQIDDDRNNP